MVKKPGASASNSLKPFAGEDVEAGKHVGELRGLERREDLGASLVTEIEAAFGQQPVAGFDFSSSVALSGIRGTRKIFFFLHVCHYFGRR